MFSIVNNPNTSSLSGEVTSQRSSPHFRHTGALEL